MRTGSTGLEDAWLTKDPVIRQFAGVFGFLLTNAHLAHKYFVNPDMKHVNFKIQLSHQMVHFEERNASRISRRPIMEKCKTENK